MYSNLAGYGQLHNEHFNENNVNSLTENYLNEITDRNKDGSNDPDTAAMYNPKMNTIGGRKTKKSKPRKKNKPRKKTRKNKSRKKQKIY